MSDFKKEIEKLKKKNSYSNIEQETINYFFNKSLDDLKSGTKLNGASPNFYIKKRLDGSGGFRVYYYLFIKEDNVYLMYTHPKTGSSGSENISDKKKGELIERLIDAKKSKDYYLLEKTEKEELKFTHLSTLPKKVV